MVYIGWLCSAAAWVCSIIVGVQAIKRQKVLPGIICIICSLFGLIYGWMKANEWGIKNLMLIFTVLFVLAVILGFTFRPVVTTTM